MLESSPASSPHFSRIHNNNMARPKKGKKAKGNARGDNRNKKAALETQAEVVQGVAEDRGGEEDEELIKKDEDGLGDDDDDEETSSDESSIDLNDPKNKEESAFIRKDYKKKIQKAQRIKEREERARMENIEKVKKQSQSSSRSLMSAKSARSGMKPMSAVPIASVQTKSGSSLKSGLTMSTHPSSQGMGKLV